FYEVKMDLKKLETFIQVAEQGSFTKAAEKLGYTQSAVSFQIKQLEENLNTVLFERINHSIKLTPKGRDILNLAHRMIALAGDIEKTANDTNEISGTIRIAMADSLCHFIFWDNFSSFHKLYPNIKLKVISTSTEEMFRLAKQNDIDLVFTLDKHIYDTNYIIFKEHEINTSLIAASKSTLTLKDEMSLNEIKNIPMILTEKGMSYRRILEEYAAKKSVELDPLLEIGDTDLICHLVEQDAGISFLPDFVTKNYVSSGKIRQIKLTDFSAGIWIQILYHRDKWVTPQMQCVMDYLCSFL
ncbi:MAG: LysR family transcriptional regulator, partial [Eubacterium sp.]|nr:LysR family transcriptional regulator [Eubacterium sp.]